MFSTGTGSHIVFEKLIKLHTVDIHIIQMTVHEPTLATLTTSDPFLPLPIDMTLLNNGTICLENEILS